MRKCQDLCDCDRSGSEKKTRSSGWYPRASWTSIVPTWPAGNGASMPPTVQSRQGDGAGLSQGGDKLNPRFHLQQFKISGYRIVHLSPPSL